MRTPNKIQKLLNFNQDQNITWKFNTKWKFIFTCSRYTWNLVLFHNFFSQDQDQDYTLKSNLKKSLHNKDNHQDPDQNFPLNFNTKTTLYIWVILPIIDKRLYLTLLSYHFMSVYYHLKEHYVNFSRFL